MPGLLKGYRPQPGAEGSRLSKRGKPSEEDVGEGKEGSATPTPPHLQAKEVPGVKVFRSSATIYFANAELYCDSLKQKVRLGSPCLLWGGSECRSSPQRTQSLPLTVSLVWCGRGPSHLPEKETNQKTGDEDKANDEESQEVPEAGGVPPHPLSSSSWPSPTGDPTLNPSHFMILFGLSPSLVLVPFPHPSFLFTTLCPSPFSLSTLETQFQPWAGQGKLRKCYTPRLY